MKQYIEPLLREIDDEKHLLKILEIENSILDKSQYYVDNKKSLREIINNSKKYVYGCFIDEKIVAWWYSVNLWNWVYEVRKIIVLEEYIWKWVWKLLFLWLLNIIKRFQWKEAELTVHPHNSVAICLYLKNNFLIESFNKDYYWKWQDRLIMRNRF